MTRVAPGSRDGDPSPTERGASDAGVHPAAVGGEGRQQRIRDMFAGIAPRYELVNRVASAGLDASWRRRVVRALDLAPGEWCLDACCGTGDLARALAAGGVRVVAADFCRPMLDVASRAAAPGAAWLEADARRLPLRDDSVSAACVAFGLRNVVPPEEGLHEMVRVVRPGGRVAVLEFGEPPHPIVRRLYHLYSRRVLPLLGDALSGRWGTYRYLPQTIGAWIDPPGLSRMMERAGLVDVTFTRMSFGVVVLHVGSRPR